MSASSGRLAGRTRWRPLRLRLLRRRRIVLEQLGHRFGQVLLTLLGLGAIVERLARHATPDELLLARLIHVHSKLPDVDGAGRTGGGAATAAVPTAAIPARPVAPARIERGVLLLRVNRG